MSGEGEGEFKTGGSSAAGAWDEVMSIATVLTVLRSSKVALRDANIFSDGFSSVLSPVA